MESETKDQLIKRLQKEVDYWRREGFDRITVTKMLDRIILSPTPLAMAKEFKEIFGVKNDNQRSSNKDR